MAKVEREARILDLEHDKVQCPLCGRWMKIPMFDLHYGRCLDIAYLVSVAKKRGEEFTREDLENCKQEVIDKLLVKYPPKGIESMESLWKKQ